jgi:hypothetical protein
VVDGGDSCGRVFKVWWLELVEIFMWEGAVATVYRSQMESRKPAVLPFFEAQLSSLSVC